jgi:hypothetical protein
MLIDLLNKIYKHSNLKLEDRLKKSIYPKLKDGTIYSSFEKRQIFELENPVLCFIKPHAGGDENIEKIIFETILNFDLKLTFLRTINFDQVGFLTIYKDLRDVLVKYKYLKTLEQIESSLHKSPNSVGQKSIIFIIHGDNAYVKMKAVKKIIRDEIAESYHKNILHSSDSFFDTCIEILKLDHCDPQK